MSDAQAQQGGQGNGVDPAVAAGQQQNDGAAQQNGQQQNGAQANQNGGQQQNGQQDGGKGSQSVAAGGGQQQEPPPYWPKDWRQKMAEHVSGGDKDRLEKELKRLETTADPTVAWARFRDMENTWATRKFIKIPGENAKPEEIAEYHKSLGVPEKPEGYLENLQLDNGAVIGDADKPMVATFAEAMHKAGTPAPAVKAALNWYFGNQEQQAAALDQHDDNFRIDAKRSLKEQYGPAFDRKRNAAMQAVFKTAAGGLNFDNPTSVAGRLLGGRTADGKIIGDDPAILSWLISLGYEINPEASVVEEGHQEGQTIETEIEKIEGVMRSDRQRYNKDTKMQTRYRELLEARQKVQARKRA